MSALFELDSVGTFDTDLARAAARAEAAAPAPADPDAWADVVTVNAAAHAATTTKIVENSVARLRRWDGWND
jgi:hypothetical protein